MKPLRMRTLSRQLELASRKGFVSSCSRLFRNVSVTTDTYGKACMYVTKLRKGVNLFADQIRFTSPHTPRLPIIIKLFHFLHFLQQLHYQSH